MNVEVERNHDIKIIPQIQEAIKNAEKRLSGKGRILVRSSGTEPKIRVMVEGKDEKLVLKIAKGVSQVVKETLK